MCLKYKKFIEGHNRTQTNLFPVSLDESISTDNEVRVIDLFVDSLSLKDYGFRTDFVENGRPAYHPSDLLKLFIYGYMNKTRSTRDLEKERHRNPEYSGWLIKFSGLIITQSQTSGRIMKKPFAKSSGLQFRLQNILT